MKKQTSCSQPWADPKVPLVITYDDGSKEGALGGAIKISHECGCRVVGNGTLPYPLTIAYCDNHSGRNPAPVDHQAKATAIGLDFVAASLGVSDRMGDDDTVTPEQSLAADYENAERHVSDAIRALQNNLGLPIVFGAEAFVLGEQIAALRKSRDLFNNLKQAACERAGGRR